MTGTLSLQRQNVRETLINIAIISRRIHTAIASTKVTLQLQTVSVWTQLDKIVATSGAMLAKFSESNTPLDPRVEDWLSGNEPDMCLRILNDMEKLIPTDRGSGASWLRVVNRVFNPTCADDKINEAVKLFSDLESVFHFLLTPEVWDYHGTTVQVQPETVSVVDSRVKRPHSACSQTDLPRRKEKARKIEEDIDQGSSKEKPIDPEKFDMLLQWLDGFNCNDTYESTSRLRQPSTCTWLPETNQYSSWRNSKDSFLWLNGKPGAGKTVIATSVIDAIKKTLQDGENIVFFYCDFRNEQTTSGVAVMRSILCQLLRKLRNGTGRDLIQLVDDMLAEKSKGTSILKYADSIASFVSRAAKQFDHRPFIVIDALDECQDIENLLHTFRKLTTDKAGRLFVTSRPLHVIKDNFHGLPSISMDQMVAEVSGDIRLHVTREVEGDRRLRKLEENLKNEICVALQRGADGMFRWIRCQIDTLKKCATPKDIREALNSLPSGLEETYERILRIIDPESSEGKLAMRALVWLVAALRAIGLVEILEALSVDLGSRRLDRGIAPVHGSALLDVLGSLVVYNEKTDILCLSHFTVKEYLVGSLVRARLPMHHIDLQVAHVDVFRLCLGYITALIRHPQLSDIDKVSTDQQGNFSPKWFPLLNYVFIHGFNHGMHIESVNNLILDDMMALRSDMLQHPVEWAQTCKLIHSYVSPLPWQWISPIHDFVIYALISSLPESFLLAFLRHAPFTAFDGTSPLVYATHLDKIKHARALLSWGINVHRAGLDIQYTRQIRPIELAFYRRHHSLFDLFLVRWKAPVPSRLFSAIFSSQYQDYLDPYMLVKLLQCDAFAEWVAEGRDPEILLYAFNKTEIRPLWGVEKLVLAVLCRFAQVGCDLSAPGSWGSMLRVAWHAASRGHLTLLWYLCSQSIPIPSRVLFSFTMGTTLIKELTSLGLDVGAIVAEGDLVLERTFGKCQRGPGCWMTDCPSCSRFLGFTPFQQCPMDILIIGRVSAGRSSLINAVTGVPEDFPDSAQASNCPSQHTLEVTCHASLWANIPLQIWNTPGFDETMDYERIKSSIDDWLLRVRSSQSKHENSDPALPTTRIVWCTNASDVDDQAAWQQFRDVYCEFRSRRFEHVLLIVHNRITSAGASSKLEATCKNKLRQLGFPNVPFQIVQTHQEASSSQFEGAGNSGPLRQPIRQDALDFVEFLIHAGRRYPIYKCNWVLPGGTICDQDVHQSDFNDHVRHDHDGPAGSRQNLVTCRWLDCGVQMMGEYISRHVLEQHLLWMYVCPHCFEQFTRRYSLQMHISRKHRPIFPFTQFLRGETTALGVGKCLAES